MALIFGQIGQLKLRKAKVLLVGMGGLGCPAAAYLAGAGVGTLGLIDGDVVEESNLHRQILHSTARVGMTKVESAMVALSSSVPAYDSQAYDTDVFVGSIRTSSSGLTNRASHRTQPWPSSRNTI